MEKTRCEVKVDGKDLPICDYKFIPLSKFDKEEYVVYRTKMEKETKGVISTGKGAGFKLILAAYSVPTSKAFLVWNSNEIVGELFLSNLVPGSFGNLQLICLLKQNQGKGLGRRLLKFAKMISCQFGCVGLKLKVEKDNLGVIGFYTSCGFAEEDDLSDSVTMSKQF